MNKNKEELLSHFEHSIDFVKKLVELSEEQWRSPIAKGKWTVAEVIGHLIPWDEFLYRDRLPFFFKDEPLPKGPDEEELNKQSAEESRRRNKEETIINFVHNRRNLVLAIHNLEDGLWTKDLKIGDTSLTLYDYFKGFMDHDKHHFEQINKVISVQLK